MGKSVKSVIRRHKHGAYFSGYDKNDKVMWSDELKDAVRYDEGDGHLNFDMARIIHKEHILCVSEKLSK